VAVGLGIISSVLGTHFTIKSILSPFAGVIRGENLTFTVMTIWMSWFAEGVLLVRVAAVFPRSQLPLLLAFPMTIKVARFVVNVLFSVQWAKRLSSAGSETQFVILQALPRTFFKVEFILELIDNGYMSALFLWRLHNSVLQGSEIQRVTLSGESKRSYASKLQRLFWIATTNFIFPLIFGLIEIFTVFFAKDVILCASFENANSYVAVISTVFATIWSSTNSFKEALSEKEVTHTVDSSRPVIFRMDIERCADFPSRMMGTELPSSRMMDIELPIRTYESGEKYKGGNVGPHGTMNEFTVSTE